MTHVAIVVILLIGAVISMLRRDIARKNKISELESEIDRLRDDVKKMRGELSVVVDKVSGQERSAEDPISQTKEG